MLGSQAPAPGTIETPSRNPLPGPSGIWAGGDLVGSGRVPLCLLSGGRSVPARRRPMGGSALLPPVGMMQQQCRKDGRRAATRPAPLPSAPGSFVSPHPTRGRQLLKLVPTLQWGPELWALFLNPTVGFLDFGALGETSGLVLREGGCDLKEQVRGVPTRVRTTGLSSAHVLGGWKCPLPVGFSGLCSSRRVAGLF